MFLCWRVGNSTRSLVGAWGWTGDGNHPVRGEWLVLGGSSGNTNQHKWPMVQGEPLTTSFGLSVI